MVNIHHCLYHTLIDYYSFPNRIISILSGCSQAKVSYLTKTVIDKKIIGFYSNMCMFITVPKLPKTP